MPVPPNAPAQGTSLTSRASPDYFRIAIGTNTQYPITSKIGPMFIPPRDKSKNPTTIVRSARPQNKSCRERGAMRSVAIAIEYVIPKKTCQVPTVLNVTIRLNLYARRYRPLAD